MGDGAHTPDCDANKARAKAYDKFRKKRKAWAEQAARVRGLRWA